MGDHAALISGPAILYERDHRDPSKLTFVSNEVTEKLGLDPRSFMTDRAFWQSRIHPDDAAGVAAGLLALPRTTRITLEYRLRNGDGAYFWIRDEAKVVQNGDTSSIVGAWTDVTETKEAQIDNQRLTRRLARASRELEQFAYVASHDLRAPLRAIDTLSEWLEHDLGDALEGDSREQMRLLRGRVRRMDRLLADLLEYARVGRVPALAEVVDPEAMIREVVDLLQLDGTLDIRIPTPLQPLVTAKAQLKRVFINLLSNAAKHNDRNVCLVEIRCRDTGEFLEYTVTDDGPGIPPEFHDRVFQMFQTLKPRDVLEGSGMGLALVRRIVELANGRIQIDSAGRRGTTFRFTWPKEWVDATPSSQTRLPEARAASVG